MKEWNFTQIVKYTIQNQPASLITTQFRSQLMPDQSNQGIRAERNCAHLLSRVQLTYDHLQNNH